MITAKATVIARTTMAIRATQPHSGLMPIPAQKSLKLAMRSVIQEPPVDGGEIVFAEVGVGVGKIKPR